MPGICGNKRSSGIIADMVIVEEVSADDWAVVREVRLRALRDSPLNFWATYADERGRDERWWRSFIEAGGWFIARDGDEPVGIAAGIEYSEAGEDERLLISMWVAPEARRAGVGGRLVEAVAKWARRVGAHYLLLEVTETNEPARRLYERHGFIATGRTTQHPREDLLEIEMRLEL